MVLRRCGFVGVLYCGVCSITERMCSIVKCVGLQCG